MSFRSDFLKVLAGEKVSKIPVAEFMWFWVECYPEYTKKAGTDDFHSHFGLGKFAHTPFSIDPMPAFEEKIIWEKEDKMMMIDKTGTTKIVEKNTSAMPHYVDFPIKDEATYKEFLKRFDPDTKERVPDNINEYKDLYDDNNVRQMQTRGAFAFLRDFIKFEDLMMMFVDNPDLIKLIVHNHTEFVIKLFSRVFKQIIPDYIIIGEDMAYKNTTMISPDMAEEFIYPSWVKIIDFCKANGVKNIILDSDGNIMGIMPLVVKAGFTGTFPVERSAGMDGEIIREKYPEFAMIGGVDKLKLAKGKKEIDEEIEKIKRLFKTGRYIPSCDHSVPPEVSYENYKYYNEKLKSLCF